MTLILVGQLEEREIRFPLLPGTHAVGRGRDCALQLLDPSVSRRHAEIEVGPGLLLVRDLESQNGTSVNGERIAAPTALAAGDRVAFAGIVLSVEEESLPLGTLTRLSESGRVESYDEVSWEEVRGARAEGEDKRARLFRVMAEAGELLAVRRAPEELFQAALDLVESALAPERIVLLLQEGEGPPVVRASRLTGPPSEQRLILSQTMVERVVADRTSLLTADALLDPRFQGQASIVAQGTRSALAAPLFDNEKVIGILYADNATPGRLYDRDDLQTFTLLANLVAVKITQARLEEAEREMRQIEMQLRTAREILQRILPRQLEEVAGYELCVHLEPCYTLGGDLYDTRRLEDGRLVVLVGDVSGKGLGAALLVSNIVPMVRLLAEEVADPLPLVTRLNRQLWRATDTTRYATLFLGVLEPESGRLAYVNAGHNPPLLVDTAGQARGISSTGMPVGMFENARYAAGELVLEPGMVLALYSDGVTEARSAADEEFGLARLRDLLCRRRGEPAERILAGIRAELAEFLGDTPAADDVTLLLIRRCA